MTGGMALPRDAATPMQVGLIYESGLAGRVRANLEQVVVIAPAGEFDAPRLERAWVALAGQHDVLRLTLRPDPVAGLRLADGGVPRVVVVAHDWSRLSRAGQDAALADLLERDRAAGADPLAGRGWRVAFADLGARGVAMLWTIHHALIDGRSLALLLDALFDVLAGQDPPAPARGFAAFAAELAQVDKTAARDWFAAALPDGALRQGFARPPGPVLPMAHLRGRLAPDAAQALRLQAAAAGATMLNAVQAAWGLLLARWTGQAEACFGLVDSGRRLFDGFDGTAGCLISTLPQRIALDGAQPLPALLAQLRGQTLAMRDHAHASPGEIRRWIGAAGDLALFDTILMFAPGTLHQQLCARGKGWDNRQVSLHEEGTAAVTLAFYDGPEPLVELEYDPARLSADRAARALDHLLRLLRAMAFAAPDAPLAALDMLPPDETAALLRLAAPDHALPPALPCIATRFEAVAAERPGAPALRNAANGRVLSFRALDQAANALAGRLAAAGLGVGDVVAVALPRGAEFVVAILGALKAGCAFLPLDPEQPPALLRDLIGDAGARAVVAREGAPLAQAAALHLIPDPGAETARPPQRPAPDAGRPAYVIYTSGSTGRPKGVVGLCGALSAHADAVIAAYGLAHGDRVLQFAGLGFDVALEEIFPTLLAGATVILRDAGSAGSVTALLDLAEREAVTVLNLPASFWHVMAEDMAARDLPLPASVRLLVTGSERVNPRALAQWRAVAPGLPWINGYGPTEATVTATAYVLAPGAPLPDVGADVPADVPVGRPLGHARAVLRAFDGTLAPHGAEAMLWIGGPAVTGGYLGQPGLTAAAFGPDPWVPGGRLYRTGDMARWRGDGQLLFLGRRDRQIKLRGHRIDLHQIETALAGLPAVQQAHVAFEPDGEPGAEPRLLAWLVCDGDPQDTDLEPLRRALAQRLPAYMLPALVAVDSLPVGPNGKIATRALPRPMRAAQVSAPADGLEPGDSLALTIAQLMARALGLDFVPLTADFHALGGDSLLALRLVSMIEAHTGRSLRAIDLHGHPSPAALARLLRHGADGPRFIIPIQPLGDLPPFFAVHVLGHNEELFRPLAAALGPDQPVYGLSVGVPANLGEIDVQRTARVYFEEIQRHHPQGPLSFGAVSMAAYFAYELAQLLRAAGREVRVLAVLDAMGPDGRPSLRGPAKIAAHLRRFRERGFGHLAAIRRHRIDQIRHLREAARTAPGEINGYNLVAANVRAVETYVPLPYDGRLTIFRAGESFWDSPAAIASGLGWASVARGGMELYDLPGTHLSILHPGNVEVLADHLRRLLAQPG